MTEERKFVGRKFVESGSLRERRKNADKKIENEKIWCTFGVIAGVQ